MREDRKGTNGISGLRWVKRVGGRRKEESVRRREVRIRD